MATFDNALRVRDLVIQQFWRPVRDCVAGAPHLLSLARNITGVGIGLRFFNGEWIPNDWVVRVYVERKYPLAFLGPLGLPDVFDGVLLDVVETGRFRPLTGPPAAGATLSVGVGGTISLEGSGADGTLGAFVKDLSGQSYLLTCSHVLRRKGVGVLQMDAADSPIGRIAMVSQKTNFLLGKPDSPPNAADCAIAALEPGVVCDPSLPDKIPPFSPSGSLKENDPVVKARSPLTQGTVLDLHATLEIHYGFGSYFFRDQILINSSPRSEFAAPGDSGSLVVKVNGTGSQPVGLVFAAGLRRVDPKTGMIVNACAVCPMNAALDLPGLTLSLL